MMIARCLGWFAHRALVGRRGSVAVMFGVSIVPMMVGTIAAIDVSRMMASKSALQRIADNAALTGAAVYVAYTASDSFKGIAETMAVSSFCNAVTNLPAGFTLTTPTSGTMKDCGSGGGPTAVGQITGYTVGSRGLTAGSGCTATNTVVAAPVKCGFAVTVTARAQMTSLSANLLGSTTVSISATAVNPFIDLGTVLKSKPDAAAANANSIWVYPVLLDDDGNPDFSTNSGALPDRSACTGSPYQFNCGVYTMLASNHYNSCVTASPCQVGSTNFGDKGVVLNPVASSAVITATTPIAFAISSAANAEDGWYDTRLTTAATPAGKVVDPTTGCVYPFKAVYNTVTQMFGQVNGSYGPISTWDNPTHWFYSSFLYNNKSPMQLYIDKQNLVGTYKVGGKTRNLRDWPIAPVEDKQAAADRTNEGITMSNPCAPISITNGVRTYADSKYIYQRTLFPTTKSNCALYIVKDTNSLTPDPNFGGSTVPEYTGGPYKTCWSPANTQGREYSILQCQSFKGHTFTFYFNDASGKGDDTDYFNGSLKVNCTANTNVVLVD